jgi:hypothetical protein
MINKKPRKRIKTYQRVEYSVKLSNHEKNKLLKLKHRITDKVNSLEKVEASLTLLEKIDSQLN